MFTHQRTERESPIGKCVRSAVCTQRRRVCALLLRSASHKRAPCIMPSEAQKMLMEVGERANDLRATLQSFDPRKLHDPAATLSHFQQLSKQLDILHGLALDEANGAANLMILPHELTADANTIPHLLSTRLDKEHEDVLARVTEHAEQASASGAAIALTAPEIEEHNTRLAAAHEHLLKAAAALDLPAAVEQRARVGGGSSSQPAMKTESIAAPAKEELNTEATKLLLTALRGGEGLRTDAKRMRTG